MRRQIFWIRLAGVVMSLVFSANCRGPENPPVHLYTDPQYGFRIASPDSGWIITDETGIPEVLVIMKSNAMAGDFVPNVNIAVENLPAMMTAREYGEKNRKFLAAQGYEILALQQTVINHNVFYDLQCLNRQVSPSVRFRYLCLVKNQSGFIITCTARENDYAVFARDFEFMVNSFRFF